MGWSQWPAVVMVVVYEEEVEGEEFLTEGVIKARCVPYL
jgi:hypothetical protein